MNIIDVKVCRAYGCLEEVIKDLFPHEVKRFFSKENLTCPVCAKIFQDGFSLSIFQQNLDGASVTNCCRECLEQYVKNNNVKMVLAVKEKPGLCVSCSKLLSELSFLLLEG